MVGQVRLNTWQGDFFDALSQRASGVFGKQVVVFFIIIAGLLVLVVAETWLREMLEVRLREWLTHDLIDLWLLPKHAYFLGLTSDIGVHPDQRMQADALRLTELSVSLGVELLRSVLLFGSFLAVLWVLSAEVLFEVNGYLFTIPGYLVWCALVYTVIGSWLTWSMGRPLIAINAERYAREAELRFSLVRISEFVEAISVHGGEGVERRALDQPINRVVEVTRRLANRKARLTWITSGYGWLAVLAPSLAVSPGYFNGTLSFGELMMTIGAFHQVQQALRWFVDSFPQIADWRATLQRVVALHEALPELEKSLQNTSLIKFAPSSSVIFQDLRVRVPDGSYIALDPPSLTLEMGEHVRIIGGAGVDKGDLFRAMAGICPGGSGTICLPDNARVMFVPQRPYLPLGSLRYSVTYPSGAYRFHDNEIRRALDRVCLTFLDAALDSEERWDKKLSKDEQRRVVMARLLLHKPHVVFFDEAMDALDGECHKLVRSILQHELEDTTVISFGTANYCPHNRTVSLVRYRPRPRLAVVRDGRIDDVA